LASEASKIAEALRKALATATSLGAQLTPQHTLTLDVLDKDVKAMGEAHAAFEAVSKGISELDNRTKELAQAALSLSRSCSFLTRISEAVDKVRHYWDRTPPDAPPVAGPNNVPLDEKAAARLAGQALSFLIAPPGLWACLSTYREWVLDQRCGDEEARSKDKWLRIIEHLPGLFKIIEDATSQWTPPDSSTPNPPDRPSDLQQSVLQELKKVEKRVRDWLESAAGLVFFPHPNEAFDIYQHDLHSSAVTDDPQKVGTISEVVRTGYRLGSDGPILRRASVVCWVKARGSGSQEPESRGP